MTREEYCRLAEGLADRLYGYAVYLLGNREEARDVAQESLMRLWENRDRVPNEAAARAWTTRTARNLAVDRMRAESVRPQADPDLLDALAGDGSSDPERTARAGEIGRALVRALGRLPARDRELIVLREIEGLSYHELSEVFDLPLGTLKAALHRARERLRDKLAAAGVRP